LASSAKARLKAVTAASGIGSRLLAITRASPSADHMAGVVGLSVLARS
jgi:hypothetical protein